MLLLSNSGLKPFLQATQIRPWLDTLVLLGILVPCVPVLAVYVFYIENSGVFYIRAQLSIIPSVWRVVFETQSVYLPKVELEYTDEVFNIVVDEVVKSPF